MARANKIGRNQACPCASGKKYKHCHGRLSDAPPRDSASFRDGLLEGVIRQKIAGLRAQQQEQIRLWGFGNKPLSTMHGENRVVAVGSRIYSINPSLTFHDFLTQFLKDTLGIAWGRAELAKPFADRHPILQWHERVGDTIVQTRENAVPGQVVHIDPTRAIAAYYGVAFDLFTVANNQALPQKLLNRLRNREQFQGARYELYVVALFVRSGFLIELEDEADRSFTHCEFNATNKRTGEQFSVEAKSRHRPGMLGQPGYPDSEERILLDFGNLLSKALSKRAKERRIVCIDVNMPPGDSGARTLPHWFDHLKSVVDMKEQQKRQDGSKLPPCYLVVTNHPYHYGNEQAESPGRAIIATGFNIPEFRSLTPADMQSRHPTIVHLLEAEPLGGHIPKSFPS